MSIPSGLNSSLNSVALNSARRSTGVVACRFQSTIPPNQLQSTQMPAVQSKEPLNNWVDPNEKMLDLSLWKQGKKAEFALTTLDKVINWVQTSSFWPMTFGLACCAVEMVRSFDYTFYLFHG